MEHIVKPNKAERDREKMSSLLDDFIEKLSPKTKGLLFIPEIVVSLVDDEGNVLGGSSGAAPPFLDEEPPLRAKEKGKTKFKRSKIPVPINPTKSAVGSTSSKIFVDYFLLRKEFLRLQKNEEFWRSKVLQHLNKTDFKSKSSLFMEQPCEEQNEKKKSSSNGSKIPPKSIVRSKGVADLSKALKRVVGKDYQGKKANNLNTTDKNSNQTKKLARSQSHVNKAAPLAQASSSLVRSKTFAIRKEKVDNQQPKSSLQTKSKFRINIEKLTNPKGTKPKESDANNNPTSTKKRKKVIRSDAYKVVKKK